MIRIAQLMLLLWLISFPAHAAQLRWFMQPKDTVGSSTPYGVNDAAGHYIQSKDARIYYEVYGDGRPIFVFHGGAVGSPYELGMLLDSLREHFKVIVISSRGHGRSEIGHEAMSYEQKAEDMYTVMRSLTHAPAQVLGFSDGAYTALKLTLMHPEAVERLVAIGCGTLKAGFFPAQLPVSLLEKKDKAYVAQMRQIMPEPERLQEFLTSYMTFWHGMGVDREVFSAISCPTLLISGDLDDHAPVQTVLAAHEMIPNSRLCVVPGAGHAVFLDNFAVTWAAIEPFVQADLSSLTQRHSDID